MTERRGSAGGETLGRRERNKQEKLARIREAAEVLFKEKGYEGTTMRQLAERADVATGTIFLYVADKRELLFLVYRDRLSRLVERSMREMPGADTPLVDRLMFAFGRAFALYAKDPELARHFIKEQVFSSGGRWEAEMHAVTRMFLERLAELLRDAQVTGEVAADVDLSQASFNIFALYFAALVSWLGGRVTADEAQRSLRAALELQRRGLRPSAGARRNLRR